MEIEKRMIIYGVYSHIIKDYLSYYKNIEDAIKVLEERSYEYTVINYERNVLLDSENYVIIAVHPIVVN